MRIITILILSCLGLNAAHAQPICGTDDIHNKLLETDPSYREQMRKNDEYTLQYVKSHPLQPTQNGLATALYQIPVVVHIVHTGGAVGTVYNPNDAKIVSVINYLNQVYDGTAAGLSGGVGDIQIQFVLAKRDPNCNPTNGIDRVNASGNAAYVANGVNRNNSGGISDIMLKNLSRWDPSQYYNIWIVNKIDGADGTSGQFIAGYALYPTSSVQIDDGAVMLTTQMEVGDKVLPHEIGHALNVIHPFEGSSGSTVCPNNSNCSLNGDRVCDTDPIRFNSTSGVVDFTCRTGTNPCTGTAYSPNTENNIMNYTNCFTLFTAGQKARMLAAMTLGSRASLASSLGGTPTYEGSVTCAPKINFATLETTLAEATETIVGCIGYKDYTFSMDISNSPSSAAIATLTTTGTALQGTDYLLSTNGNFTTPSATITFPAGIRESRSFTIRIFDDGAVENNKTIIIDYSLNTGGGNAQKGIVSQSTITLQDNDAIPNAVIVQQAQIGEASIQLGSATSSQPLDPKLANKKSLVLYRAAELTAMGLSAGQISSFGIYLNKASTRPYTNLQIKMGATNLQNLIDGSGSLVSPNAVKSIGSYNPVNGLNLFVLDVPFTWNGTSSVAVEICYNNVTADATQAYDYTLGYYDGGSATQGNFYWNNTNTCATAFSSFNYYPQGLKPSCYFVINTTGPQIATAINTIGTTNVGPNADVFFYSAAGNILARIKNLTSFDYGCTEVKIDRAGSAAKDYTTTDIASKVADKTITITPTNNNPTGAYELTLYYKAAEVAGWKSSTGLLWADAKILKTPNAVSTYAPGMVPVDNVVAQTATKNFYGTDSTITATFTTGFSGFAVGNPTLLLPVVYTFTGNGLWTLAGNWANNAIPPDSLPSGQQIIISPMDGGECILNKPQTILPGATLSVQAGKRFTIQNNLQITQ